MKSSSPIDVMSILRQIHCSILYFGMRHILAACTVICVKIKKLSDSYTIILRLFHIIYHTYCMFVSNKIYYYVYIIYGKCEYTVRTSCLSLYSVGVSSVDQALYLRRPPMLDHTGVSVKVALNKISQQVWMQHLNLTKYYKKYECSIWIYEKKKIATSDP